MKASARAYAIQGLIKYHGLRNQKLRIPYHDSISVCMKSLPTVTTVEFRPDLARDYLKINGKVPSRIERSRVRSVLDRLRQVAGRNGLFARVESRNPDVNGKGLGFSAAGFAALGLAGAKALKLGIGLKGLSQVVRLGAGSATRGLVGGFSIWYANKGGLSYAEQLAPASSIKLRTMIIPIPSEIKTEKAHGEAVSSPLYRARLKYLRTAIPRMKSAIARRDPESISSLAEEDTLNLHAVTMTGSNGMILFSPLSLKIMAEIRRLRDAEDVPAWFSLDTGPSVFINTRSEDAARVRKYVEKFVDGGIVSEPGGPAEVIDKHLF